MQKTMEDSGEIEVSDVDFGDNCVLKKVDDDEQIEVSDDMTYPNKVQNAVGEGKVIFEVGIEN